jgi:multidrug efflux pump subunit AcrA (membrane-fusion protein)
MAHDSDSPAPAKDPAGAASEPRGEDASPAPKTGEETADAPAPSGGRWRRTLPALAAALVLLLVALWQAGVFRFGQVAPGRQAGGAEAAAGEILTVTPTPIPRLYTAVGTVQSRDEVDVSPRIAARILEVTVRSGDRVEKNQVLVRLDDSDLTAAMRRAREQAAAAEAGIAQAKEAVVEAEAALELAAKEKERITALFEKKVVPRQELDQALSRYRQSQAAVNQARQAERAAIAGRAAAEQAVQLAEARLSYATIRSPMAGIVSERLVDPGDMASPGRILLSLFDATLLRLEVPVRESLVQAIDLGQTIPFRVPALQRTFEGEVREIVPAVDPGSRTFRIRICIGAAKGLRPGMFGTMRLTLGSEPALLVPARAVRRAGQVEYLRMMTEDGPRQRLVRTVPAEGDARRVVSGLVPGARIVVPPAG